MSGIDWEDGAARVLWGVAMREKGSRSRVGSYNILDSSMSGVNYGV